MVDPNTEIPVERQERGPEAPVVGEVREVFEEKAQEVQGDRTVYETHREAFDKIVSQIPEDQRGSLNIRIADFWNKVGGSVHEQYVRLGNFVYNLTNPMSWLSGDVPKDFIYEREKAKVRAHGEVKAMETRQQTIEHEAFKGMIPFGVGKVLDIMDRIVGPKLP